jgi:hypothetical protein
MPHPGISKKAIKGFSVTKGNLKDEMILKVLVG